MIKREEKLRSIMDDLHDGGFGKDVPIIAIKQAIMRNVGFSEATIKQYVAALEAFSLIKRKGKSEVWVIQ